MSHQGDFDEETSRRAYGSPYTAQHPVPTIQRYREHRAELKENMKETEEGQEEQDGEQDSRARRAYESVKRIAKDEDKPDSNYNPYPTSNRNAANRPMREDVNQTAPQDETTNQQSLQENSTNTNQKDGGGGDGDQGKSATETAAGHIDPKQKRRDMKKIKRTGGGREVTDPVTHLPVIIHDRTDKDLERAPENEPAVGSHARTFTGLSGANKSRSQLDLEQSESQHSHDGLMATFPPPDFEDTKAELARTYKLAMTFGLGSIAGLAILVLLTVQVTGSIFSNKSHEDGRNAHGLSWRSSIPWVSSFFVILLVGGAGFLITTAVSDWLSSKVREIWEDETWDAARQRENRVTASDKELPESVAWLNSLLASVWPMINPDLFASLVDMLEDVMQASLPKLIRMVSIDDIGQGSESIRILGIRWLPTGAASQSVDAEGNLKKPEDNKQSDRTTPGEGEIDGGEDQEQNHVDEKPKAQREQEQQRKERQQEQQAIREGMEAEEGDFVNVELAFSYRARSTGKSLKTKVKNAHLYLKFYLPGGIMIPVWVELRGIIGTMRLRLQLSPDPPFFSLCTLTFLGQPRADLSCVPLSKHNLNIMDVPLISSFVQSAIDAALAEYVAPKSLTLDLKDMLVGDDFKKDTVTRGVVLLFIKRARGFKEGDGGIGPLRGSSDSYVTVSWGKFGKPVFSTRVIVDSQEPDWHEWASILVTPDELNAEEKLRVQLWDSDKFTADDDLGRVEVDLKELMHSPKTKNKMCDREDQFKGEDPDEEMPGKLTWSVGYFAKTRIQPIQLEKQKVHPEIQTKDELKKFVSKEAEHKLREVTSFKDESDELRQQKVQDYKEIEDEMIISTPPLDDYRSGIFSIQIHNITGLEVQRLNKESKGDSHEDREDEADQSDSLPDSYATIILNHRKVYRTRTKPKNAKPFFNAGTERYIRDWTTAEVMVSVRDSREKENDPLLGVVYLPLRKVFEKTSQVMATYPLAGGIGYGRARISMVWRSVEVKLPKEIMGWDYGTLEIKPPVKVKETSQSLGDIGECRIKLRTNMDKIKMQPVGVHTFQSNDDSGGRREWRPKKKNDGDSCFVAVRKRYASPLVIEWRKSSIGLDSTAAFAVFWLSELPDEEEKTITMKIWKGSKESLRRAESSCGYHGMEDNEEPLGEIEVTLKLWRGLSGYHKRYADKARTDDVRNVMEVLDTISDEKMDEDEHETGSSSHTDSDSDSDTDYNYDSDGGKVLSEDAATKRKLHGRTDENPSDVESESASGIAKIKQPITAIKEKASDLLNGDSDKEDDGKRGARGQLQDYKKNHKQLHRKHRGVMQWNSVRTMDWMAGKMKRGKGRVEDLFHHSEKDQGIETEV